LVGVDHVREWAFALSATVIAVDYRVAPENRTAGRCPTAVPTSPGHPSSRRRSTSTHRRIDASAVVVVGISAGGGLAAGAVLVGEIKQPERTRADADGPDAR